MKRLLLAAGLALACHGALFATGPSWLRSRWVQEPTLPRAVTLTLEYRQPPKAELKPIEKTPKIQPKKTPKVQPKKTPKTQAKETPAKPPSMKVQTPRNAIPKPAQTQPKQATKTKEKREASLDPRKEKQAAVIPKTVSRPKANAPPEEILFEQPDEIKDAAGGSQKDAAEAAETPSDSPKQIASIPPVKTLKEAKPLYLKNPPPTYPRLARKRGYEGTVVLEVLVDEKGQVGELRVLESSGYEILDRAASRSVKDWVFEPGKRGDKTVEMWVKVPLRFQIQ